MNMPRVYASRDMTLPVPSSGSRRRSLPDRYRNLLIRSLVELDILGQEERELLDILLESSQVLVDLPEGSRWT